MFHHLKKKGGGGRRGTRSCGGGGRVRKKFQTRNVPIFPGINDRSLIRRKQTTFIPSQRNPDAGQSLPTR